MVSSVSYMTYNYNYYIRNQIHGEVHTNRRTQLLTMHLSLCPVFALCKVLQNIISLYCTIHISEIFDNIYLNDLLSWTHSLLAWWVKIKPRSHCVLGHHRLHSFQMSQHNIGAVTFYTHSTMEDSIICSSSM